MSSVDVNAGDFVPLGSPEPGLTGEEMVARARALVPLIVDQADRTEKQTFYSEEIHQAFLDNGLYMINHPKRYGGYELGLDTFYKVLVEIASGDASTAWCFGIGTGHTIALAAYWPEEVQQEVLTQGPFICPATWKPEGVARRVEGGWEITGTFHYASGSPYANYFWSHALTEEPGEDGEPRIVQFLMPRSSWERLDDWGSTLGLRGSGSHSIRMEKAFAPDRFVILDSTFMDFDPAVSAVGAKLHGNPLYNGRPDSWFSTEFTAFAVGLAKGGLQAYADLMNKSTPIPPIVTRSEDYDYQLWYGEAYARVIAAESILDGAVRHMEKQSANGTFAIEDDLLATRLGTEVIAMCWETVHRYFARTGGSAQMRAGTRIDRIFRDMAQLMSHNGFVLTGDVASRDLARLAFGVKPGAGTRSLLPR
ncbi:acyl-CoA dehydrogenase family protein [Mycolicibacterium litorale]|uniref:acyl-CoA dehydrogenase family protein n=1 Tax=Mycolicibacterium litorale TaxID=758802 RepID=UPI003CE91408